MKQAKKIFTRMLMNNWGGVSHKVMEFHEYVNLFSGKSGSGKSTVMDAIQVVLYGSISATFLRRRTMRRTAEVCSVTCEVRRKTALTIVMDRTSALRSYWRYLTPERR